MLDFRKVQDAFPGEPLTLHEGKIYHNDILLLTRWPTEKDMTLYRHYHGNSADNLYYELICDDIQCRIDARTMPFEEVVAASRDRVEQKFKKK
jgi:hypothetical protein